MELVGFCMALSMGIPGGFWGNAGFSGKLGFGVVSGDLGGQKAFVQIASCKVIFQGHLGSLLSKISRVAGGKSYNFKFKIALRE